jgi:hypothetical protein
VKRTTATPEQKQAEESLVVLTAAENAAVASLVKQGIPFNAAVSAVLAQRTVATTTPTTGTNAATATAIAKVQGRIKRPSRGETPAPAVKPATATAPATTAPAATVKDNPTVVGLLEQNAYIMGLVTQGVMSIKAAQPMIDKNSAMIAAERSKPATTAASGPLALAPVTLEHIALGAIASGDSRNVMFGQAVLVHDGKKTPVFIALMHADRRYGASSTHTDKNGKIVKGASHNVVGTCGGQYGVTVQIPGGVKGLLKVYWAENMGGAVCETPEISRQWSRNVPPAEVIGTSKQETYVK